MNANEIEKALRWLAKETEFVFAAEQLNDAADCIESLQAQLAKSQRREKVAAKDLKSLHGENSLCGICKHFNVDFECSPCADCKGNPHIIVSEFEWRGAERMM